MNKLDFIELWCFRDFVARNRMPLKHKSRKFYKIKGHVFLIIFLITLLFLSSCSNKSNNSERKNIDPKEYKEPLIEANKELVKSENEQIADYIARYNWDMKTKPSGLRYLIYKEGDGEKANTGKMAKINYTIELLNGEVCYSSEKKGPKEFLIGGAEVESGLNEAILLLKVGDRAKFIIPSHLAFGLAGDKDKIPLRATLIYDIELLELK